MMRSTAWLLPLLLAGCQQLPEPATSDEPGIEFCQQTIFDCLDDGYNVGDARPGYTEESWPCIEDAKAFERGERSAPDFRVRDDGECAGIWAWEVAAEYFVRTTDGSWCEKQLRGRECWAEP